VKGEKRFERHEIKDRHERGKKRTDQVISRMK
jgi:hypothetical protein